MLRRSTIAILGASLCALAVPATAQEREPVAAKVKLDDLNLNTRPGQQVANDRLKGAAREACKPGEDDQCRAEVMTSGAATVAVMGAEQRRVAQARQKARSSKRANASYRHCYWSKRYNKRTCVWRRR